MIQTIIRQLREAYNYTQEEVSKYLHVQRTTYTRYETGTNRLSFETLCKLADLYNVTTDFLLERDTSNIPKADPQLMVLYNNAPQIFKDIVIEVLKKAQEYNQNFNQVQNRACIPVIGKEVMGIPLVLLEKKMPHDEEIIKDIKINIGDFAIIAPDDSMIDENINKGDYIIIRPQSGVNNGEIALVSIGERSLLRKVYEQKNYTALFAANGKYETEYFKISDNLYIIGKMITIIKKQ